MVWGSFPFYTEHEICFDEVNMDFGITPECKDIIRKCLKKCPKERPSLLELFDTPFIKQTKLNEGSEDLTNSPVPGTSPNSISASHLTHSEDLNNASPIANLESEDLTNAPNPETSVSPNSFSASNLSSEDLTNASKPQLLRSPHKPTDNYSKKESVTANLIKVNMAAGEKRKCEITQVQTDFELDVNTETSIKRKKKGLFKSFENQTDAIEAALMFHEKESRKGQKNTKKEKKRSRSR